jgi:chromosome segregation ATPase
MMDETGKPPDGEELAALQEQLADARAEVERLQLDAANAEARAQHAVAETAALRDDLHAAHAAGTAAAAEASSLRTQFEEATQRARAGAERYRDLVVRTEPALPADLIAGDDVDTIDASVTAAREIVGRVRSHIEAQAHASRVPAGAPPRSSPDLSALTPEQKIRHGLAQRG